MAYLIVNFVDYTYVSLSIEGLENPSGDYTQFHFKNVTTGVNDYTPITTSLFMNLQEGTQYTFSAEANYQGIWYSCGTVIVTTLYHAPPPVPAYAPVLTARVEGGLSLQWGASDGSTTYLRYRNYSGVYTEYSMLDTYYTLTGLEYGTTYYLSVRAKNIWKYSAYTEEATATTAPKTPSIDKVEESGNGVTIKISGMEGNFDYVIVFCYDSNWNVVASQSGDNNQSVSFSGLAQGVTYHFQAWSYYTVNGTQLQSVGYTQIDVVLNTRPQSWSWSYAIYSGGNVYNTIQVSGIIKAYLMLATEWNNFCNRINEFRIYKNLPQYGNFPTINSESDCTPSVLNHAVWAINAMGFSISEFTSGNIPASIFLQMRDAINSIT